MCISPPFFLPAAFRGLSFILLTKLLDIPFACFIFALTELLTIKKHV